MRVKVVAEIMIAFDFDPEEYTDGVVLSGDLTQALQDEIGYTGAEVVDVTEWTEVGPQPSEAKP